MFTITYKPEIPEDQKTSDKVLHLTQRSTRGGSIGDVVMLRDGETAEITFDDADGVQITAVEMQNVPQTMTPPPPPDEVQPPTPEEA